MKNSEDRQETQASGPPLLGSLGIAGLWETLPFAHQLLNPILEAKLGLDTPPPPLSLPFSSSPTMVFLSPVNWKNKSKNVWRQPKKMHLRPNCTRTFFRLRFLLEIPSLRRCVTLGNQDRSGIDSSRWNRDANIKDVQSTEVLLARRLALRTPGELCGFSGAITESSQRGPKVVGVVLDEFKSHLEVRGTAGAPHPTPIPASRGFPDTAGGFLQVPPPPSPRDRAAPVERRDTCQSSRRHGVAATARGNIDGSRRSSGGRQMASASADRSVDIKRVAADRSWSNLLI
ncbi:unnamed protein product [Leuciscus chuanchicus]